MWDQLCQQYLRTVCSLAEPSATHLDKIAFENKMDKMARRTRKNSKKHSAVGYLPEYANTFYGLHHWYNAKFEKLGWMLLAKAKGQNDKISEYKRGIDRLLMSIEHVMGEYQDLILSFGRPAKLNIHVFNCMRFNG